MQRTHVTTPRSIDRDLSQMPRESLERLREYIEEEIDHRDRERSRIDPVEHVEVTYDMSYELEGPDLPWVSVTSTDVNHHEIDKLDHDPEIDHIQRWPERGFSDKRDYEELLMDPGDYGPEASLAGLSVGDVLRVSAAGDDPERYYRIVEWGEERPYEVYLQQITRAQARELTEPDADAEPEGA